MRARLILTLGSSLLWATTVRPAAADSVTGKLYPAGGGDFAISLSACNGTAALLNGSLANNTGETWLYIEIQLKVTQETSTTTYRLNLERVGPKGVAILQPITGPANQDCASIRLSGLELISAYSEARAGGKKR